MTASARCPVGAAMVHPPGMNATVGVCVRLTRLDRELSDLLDTNANGVRRHESTGGLIGMGRWRGR